MHFNHYISEAALLAVDLVNLPEDQFTADALIAPLSRRAIANTALSDEQARELQAWAHQLRGIFVQPTTELRVLALNSALESAASRPYISTHDGTAHLHYTAAQAQSPAGHIKAVTAAGLATFACLSSPDRLGTCAHHRCGRVFADQSRAGRQRYCSTRCANTAAVARHRSRHTRTVQSI